MSKINLVWIQGQGCSGDTVALIGAREPSLVDALTGILPEVAGINLAFHPTIMTPWGEEAVSVLKKAKNGKLDPFVLLLEGSIPQEKEAGKTGGFFCAIGETEGKLLKLTEVLLDLKDKAAVSVAIGSCAAYGGIPHGNPNPTGAMGLAEFFTESYKSGLGLPVVNLPGCPANGDHVIKALVYLVLLARGILKSPPELDQQGRPVFLYGEKVHEICPKAGYFATGQFAHEYGDHRCLGLLGCKGIITRCAVARDGFVEGFGGCPTVGAPCIGCVEPEFPDKPFSPFLGKAPAGIFIKEAIDDAIGHIKAGLHRLTQRRI
jgi:hydrogenase small subunit